MRETPRLSAPDCHPLTSTPMNKVVVAFAAVALSGFACRSTPSHQDVVDNTDWSYPDLVWTASKDAFHDLFDIAFVNTAVGDGLLADAQLTKIAHLGLGWVDGVRAGTRPRALGVWSQRQAEYGLSIFYWRDINRQAVYGTETLFDQSMSYKGFDMDHQSETGHWLDVGANVHLLLVGAEAWVSPKEALDFGGSLIRWVVTVIPIRSALHAIGVDMLGPDVSSDDTDAPHREAGGSAAGAVYQGDTPFFEREHDPATVKPLEPMAPKKDD